MDNYQTPEPQNAPSENLLVNPEIRSLLTEAAKWAKFLGTVGYVLVGFMVIAAFFAGTFMNFMGRSTVQANPESPFASSVFSVMMGGYFLLIALLYYFPSRYLHQFGVKTQAALRHNEQLNFTLAFNRLKSFFKFFGILTIVFLVLYGAALVFMIFFGAMFGNTAQGIN